MIRLPALAYQRRRLWWCAFAFAAAVALSVACGRLAGPARTAATVLHGAAEVLEALANADGPGGLLDLALGYLQQGDLPACCAALKSHLLQYGDDPRVRAVLVLLEAEIERS